MFIFCFKYKCLRIIEPLCDKHALCDLFSCSHSYTHKVIKKVLQLKISIAPLKSLFDVLSVNPSPCHLQPSFAEQNILVVFCQNIFTV